MKEWLVDTLGLDPDIAGAVQVIIAFVVILTLIGIFTWILARIKGMRIETARRSRQPRLAVMDSTPIDNQRRLVLVRRDAVEHLILVGGETDIVVEQTIVRGAPIVAQPQRQPFPAAVPAPPAQAVAQAQPAATAQAQPPQAHPPQAQPPQAQPPQPQPAQAQRPSGGQQSAPATAQRPRPAPQQRPAAPAPAPGQRPGAEAAPTRQPAAPAEQKKSAARTGLVGAAAGALGFGQKKTRDDAPPAEASSADAVQRALTPAQNEQPSARPNGPAAPVAPAPAAPAASPPPASAPVGAKAGSGAAPSVNLEQAIGKAVAEEATARPQPAQQDVPDARAQTKLSPKDELASQLEELLNTPPPVKPEKEAPVVKPDGEQPGTKSADAAGAAPEIRSPAAPEAPKPAAPAVAPPVSSAPRPQSPQPTPAPAQSPAQSPPQPSAPSPAPADGRRDPDHPRVEAEPAVAKADSVPDVSPPPRADADKTIPGSGAAPKIEPRIEPQQDRSPAAGPSTGPATGEAPKIAAIPSAPPVSSPVAPQNSAASAPEPRVDAPESDAKSEKSDSIASIEEEMAKLLSELSGPPKT